jgi:branched-chain amino acid transport system substrate-binding protein
MKKILLPVVALLIAALAFQSCKKARTLPITKAIKVQGLFSLSGNWKSLGLNSRVAMQLAADDINHYLAQKNSPYSVAVDVSDTKLDVNMAASQFTDAKNAGINFIIGPQSSAELAAIKPLADASNVIVVSQSSTAGSLAIAGDGIFRFCPSDKIEGAATGNTIYNENIRGLVTVARDDAGNKGLQTSVGAAFTAKGGEVSAVTPYAVAGKVDSAAVVANIKAKVATLVTKYGVGGVGVYIASFDEATAIFKVAANDADLSAVKWYGGDGVVLSDAFLKNAVVADFAIKTHFFAPNVGIPASFKDKAADIAKRIKDISGTEPDAFALAVYDAMWNIAYTLEATDWDVSDYAKIKSAFVEQAAKHQGVSGADVLDEAGDRASGTFDYFGIVKTGDKYQWSLFGKSDK